MLWTTVRAMFERDFAGRTAFRFGFVMNIVGGVFFFAALFYVAKLIPKSVVGGRNYFAVTAIGLGIFGYLGAVLSAPRAFLISELGRGTIETLLTLKPSLLTYMKAAAIQQGARASGRALLVFGIGAFLGGGMTWRGAGWLLVLLPLAGLAAFGVGLIQAGIEMKVRKAGQLSGLVSGASVVLTGVYFPVALLPEGLQVLSRCIPTTYAINAARGILFDGRAPVMELAVLTVLALIFLLLGAISFRSGHRAMRREGTYLTY